ncbi:MAG: hypothetical protein A2583_05290 [Bdellovibrionales bacterium RIFOXYD1_FULL_53_11]|nr:MAG: hypothetical protein A2583_05290 [Bdellovibrionales bacterium RIFOXYD1_FULL_53_11]
MTFKVSKEEFERLVGKAVDALPRKFAKILKEEVPVVVRFRPARDEKKNLGLEEDELLLGLSTGPVKGGRVLEDSGGQEPPMIHLFQGDIEESSDSRAGLEREVRMTLIHELGHYLGMTEEDMERLGYE